MAMAARDCIRETLLSSPSNATTAQFSLSVINTEARSLAVVMKANPVSHLFSVVEKITFLRKS